MLLSKIAFIFTRLFSITKYMFFLFYFKLLSYKIQRLNFFTNSNPVFLALNNKIPQKQLQSIIKSITPIMLLLTSLFFTNCNTNNSDNINDKTSKKRLFPQYTEYTEQIIKSDSSVIRGLNLNVPASLIKKIESVPPSIEKKDTLEYNYQIDSIVNYSIKYTLHNDSLEEINIWIYSNNPDISTQIFTELKEYYQQKLPNSIEDKGYVVYNCVQGERRPFVVSISDFSTPTKGQINLVIYKDR